MLKPIVWWAWRWVLAAALVVLGAAGTAAQTQSELDVAVAELSRIAEEMRVNGWDPEDPEKGATVASLIEVVARSMSDDEFLRGLAMATDAGGGAAGVAADVLTMSDDELRRGLAMATDAGGGAAGVAADVLTDRNQSGFMSQGDVTTIIESLQQSGGLSDSMLATAARMREASDRVRIAEDDIAEDDEGECPAEDQQCKENEEDDGLDYCAIYTESDDWYSAALAVCAVANFLTVGGAAPVCVAISAVLAVSKVGRMLSC